MPSLPPFPAAAADQCVKCGLCLPHCPSYTLTGHEGDSPRGRIALMQGLAEGRLAASDRLQQHLDGCLGCRACEPVCPARVPYGQILDAGRAQLAMARPARWHRAALRGLTHPLGQRLLQGLRWLWQTLRLARPAGALGLFRLGALGRAASLLPAARLPQPAALPAPAASADRGEVLLFTGCTGAALEPETVAATEALLSALGFTPRTLTGLCCGALQTHAGDAEGGAARARAAGDALAGDAPIISIGTGCGAQLQEHPMASVRERHVDALQFIRRHWPEGVTLQPLPQRVALHVACSQRNVLRSGDDLAWLGRQIPQAEVFALDASGRCCGAAGHHLLQLPDVADAHLAPKLAAMRDTAPQWVVSNNIGCSLHLAGGLRRDGALTPQVIHPLVLLARLWPRR